MRRGHKQRGQGAWRENGRAVVQDPGLGARARHRNTVIELAAARFTKSQGADPKKTYLYGESQGGWTVLRTLSGHNLAPEVKSLYADVISLYPNCFATEYWYQSAPNKSTDGEFAPPLGPYAQPVIVFRGTADQATPVSQCDTDMALKTAECWSVFEGGTHAWHFPTNGVGLPSVDGRCTRCKKPDTP